jgi:two-component system NarL family sensor kinase
VSAAVDDVRRVTDDLRPAGLDELGLRGSLEALCLRASSDGMEVCCEVGALPSLVPAVEVACYRIAAEAVANAVRHSGARRVRLAASVVGARLRLEVSDDGQGLPSVTRAGGLGLASIRERAAEVGGRAVLESAAGAGLRVVAELPVDVA